MIGGNSDFLVPGATAKLDLCYSMNIAFTTGRAPPGYAPAVSMRFACWWGRVVVESFSDTECQNFASREEDWIRFTEQMWVAQKGTEAQSCACSEGNCFRQNYRDPNNTCYSSFAWRSYFTSSTCLLEFKVGTDEIRGPLFRGGSTALAEECYKFRLGNSGLSSDNYWLPVDVAIDENALPHSIRWTCVDGKERETLYYDNQCQNIRTKHINRYMGSTADPSAATCRVDTTGSNWFRQNYKNIECGDTAYAGIVNLGKSGRMQTGGVMKYRCANGELDCDYQANSTEAWKKNMAVDTLWKDAPQVDAIKAYGEPTAPGYRQDPYNHFWTPEGMRNTGFGESNRRFLVKDSSASAGDPLTIYNSIYNEVCNYGSPCPGSSPAPSAQSSQRRQGVEAPATAKSDLASLYFVDTWYSWRSLSHLLSIDKVVVLEDVTEVRLQRCMDHDLYSSLFSRDMRSSKIAGSLCSMDRNVCRNADHCLKWCGENHPDAMFVNFERTMPKMVNADDFSTCGFYNVNQTLLDAVSNSRPDPGTKGCGCHCMQWHGAIEALAIDYQPQIHDLCPLEKVSYEPISGEPLPHQLFSKVLINSLTNHTLDIVWKAILTSGKTCQSTIDMKYSPGWTWTAGVPDSVGTVSCDTSNNNNAGSSVGVCSQSTAPCAEDGDCAGSQHCQFNVCQVNRFNSAKLMFDSTDPNGNHDAACLSPCQGPVSCVSHCQLKFPLATHADHWPARPPNSEAECSGAQSNTCWCNCYKWEEKWMSSDRMEVRVGDDVGPAIPYEEDCPSVDVPTAYSQNGDPVNTFKKWVRFLDDAQQLKLARTTAGIR